MATELEVPAADAQAVDTWFEPSPEHQAERQRMGVLGRMAEGPTMFEPFRDTPGVDDLRACLRKQLMLDHGRVLEARKHGQPRPPFPRLWLVATGRPESVLTGYRLTPMGGWPSGFYEGGPAEARGVVVLRELPRTRETLLVRLLATGAVLAAALEELKQLPPEAWERQVALPALVAARMEMAQAPGDEREQEYLRMTESLYEQWEAATREQGRQEAQRLYEQREAAIREQGRQEAQRLYEQREAAIREQERQEGQVQEAQRAVALLYQARFGPMPQALRNALEATSDTATLERWLVLVGTRPEAEVAAALQADRATPER
ncbi:MAG TPA: hypothetical protein VFS43_25205 [Polyangiaceae bacterium]|nr:hypothetical protein [Polyangiaceae bacterium]